ncbi:16S rRNA methyltransferase [Pontibacillus halophilus JSM 076056 = DSM 19796]|uniref:Ribosomal RNA small subunit methyltransferase E n=1 Tax=Pontibacillus halophilus JSM 076056 = DSM 19796 TaxID=1385510 RepID=A0A0A5GNP3_9BACI|nr:16S rRNA (uracil(1498)-N(3))-methyltransferase [Pontibacillus halophilus]KGX93574.1 16S rRNA methyltransferase [Pontibacillus halophilus JSM 076056 = DSM 19796]
MQRYFIPASGWQEGKVIITGEDAHHIKRVMRMTEDDEIICCTPDGRAALCQLEVVTEDDIKASIVRWLDEQKELPVNVTIVQGLPKGDKMELVIQKGTELGAHEFIPFAAERSIVKWDGKKAKKKIERYQKIAKEASEQSHRTQIPQVNDVHTLDQIASLQSYDWKLFAFEDEAKSSTYRSLKEVIPNLTEEQSVLIVIGPEGGLSEKEVDVLKTHEFLSVRLGPRILRSETAHAYILSSISYQLEELNQ